MSASWRSEPARRARTVTLGALTALVTLAGLAVAPTVASARVHRSTVVDTGSVRRISISDRGIVVERSGSQDTTLEWGGSLSDGSRRDRLRHRIRTGIRRGIESGGGGIEIDDNGTGIVRIWSDAHVEPGKVVDGDVVAVFGSVTVEGEVTGDVVAVLGSVHLKSGAKVEGDVVSIGGGLETAEGVTVHGESVQLGFSPFTWGLPGVSVLLFAVVAGWLVSMFMGWIFALLFPTGMLRVATVVERRPAASFFLGVLSVPGFIVAMVLLCITVIGIPIGVLLPMVYVLMGYAGQLAATCVLGARLTRRSLANGLMIPLLVGTLFVALLLGIGSALMAGGSGAHPASLFLTLSGVLLLLGLGTLGTGAFLLSRFGTRPHEVVWHGHTATAPGAAPGPNPSQATL
jgi:hypothetical protein